MLYGIPIARTGGLIVIAIGMLISCVLPGKANAEDPSPTAEEAVRRFLAKQNEMTPIVGEFAIATTFQRTEEQRAKMRSSGLKIQPDEQSMNCRWAFDAKRESFEMLSGNTDVYRRFFIGDDHVIEGISSKSYSLNTLRKIGVTRPGSFYFLDGANERWETLLRQADVKMSVRSSNGGLLLEAVQPRGFSYELLLDRDSFQLKSARALQESRALWNLQIVSFVKDPKSQRQFPGDATMEVVDPRTGVTIKRSHLKAKKVEFPTPGPGWKGIDLELPKGSVVADKLMNRAIMVERSTPASELIARPSQAVTRSYSSSPPAVAIDKDGMIAAEMPKDWVDQYWVYGLSLLSAAAAFVLVRHFLYSRTRTTDAI